MLDKNYFLLDEFLEYEDFIVFVNKIEPVLMQKRVEFFKNKKHNFGIYDEDVKMLYKLKKINIADANELEFFKSLTLQYKEAYLYLLISNRENDLKEYKFINRALCDSFEILNRHYRSLNNYVFAFNVAEQELNELSNKGKVKLRVLDDIQTRMEKYSFSAELEYHRLMEVENSFLEENGINFNDALNYSKELSKNIMTASKRIQHICTFMDMADETYKEYHINQLKTALTPLAKKVLRNREEIYENANEKIEELFTFN